MSGVSSFILAFCTMCVVMGGVYMLSPTGNMSRSVKFALSLSFVCCLLTGVINLDFPEIEGFSFQAQINKSEEMSAAAAERIFEDALTRGGIIFSEIDVCTDKLSDGSISIIEVVVYSPESPQKIEELIGNSDVYKVRVVNE